MRYAATREEMQQIDEYSICEIGIPGIVLMERAAMAASGEIISRFPKEKTVLIVVEKGNNGGDGIAMARILSSMGYEIDLYEIGGIKHESEQYSIQKKIAQNLELKFLNQIPDRNYDLIIDAIFGVGLSRKVTGIQKEVIEKLNEKSGIKVAIDVPSGINASTGKKMGCAFLADYTITFGLNKIGLLLYPGADYAGEVIVKDIGFPRQAVEKISPKAIFYEKEDLNQLPKRKNRSNKGTYGRVLVIAGSKNMAGAAYFNAKAAYMSGCGLVQLFTHESNRVILQTKLPEAILTTYEDREDALEKLEMAVKQADAIVFGSGMGVSELTRMLFVFLQHSAQVPVVLDADGINCVHMKGKEELSLSQFQVPCIITPHLKEASRLLKRELSSVKEDLIQTARLCVEKARVTCVLKDARTVVMDEQGETYINITGNHGMATGGSGDVLAGIIGGFLAEGLSVKEAAFMAVFCHGMAGDLAKEKKSAYSMLASDIIEQLPFVLGGK